jgi:nicotinic acid mononucleotide adenylyltransferase
MSRIAAGGIPGSEVSDFEIRGGARYTIDTAEMLWEKYKPDRLWLIMGSDMSDGFDTWHRAGDLRRMVEIYAVPRDKLPVSSTGFRETLDGEMLPPGVWEYIKRENLYKEERIRRN